MLYISGMNNMNIDYVVDLFGGVLVDNDGTEHHRVRRKPYDIVFNPMRLEWSCSCPAYKFRKRHRKTFCKHIEQIQEHKLNERRHQGRDGARVVNGVDCKSIIREFDSHPSLKQKGQI